MSMRAKDSSMSEYISDKSQVPMLQLIYSTWVTHLQVWETAGMLHECIWNHVNFNCGLCKNNDKVMLRPYVSVST